MRPSAGATSANSTSRPYVSYERYHASAVTYSAASCGCRGSAVPAGLASLASAAAPGHRAGCDRLQCSLHAAVLIRGAVQWGRLAAPLGSDADPRGMASDGSRGLPGAFPQGNPKALRALPGAVCFDPCTQRDLGLAWGISPRGWTGVRTQGPRRPSSS